MNLLDDLAIQFGADKSSRHHNYTENYYQYFQSLKEHKINLLEIGVNRGASLRMWKGFFPLANIYGMDIGAGCKAFEEDRITIFIGDQSNPADLSNIIEKTGPLDIIIDDGSHVWSHQIATFKFLFKHVKPGGMYIVEDCRTSYWPEFGIGGKSEKNAVDFFKGLVDDININGYLHTKSKQISNPCVLLDEKTSANEFEKTIKSIHFYCSMIFILKR